VSGTDGFLLRGPPSRAGKSIKDKCVGRASAMGRDGEQPIRRRQQCTLQHLSDRKSLWVYPISAFRVGYKHFQERMPYGLFVPDVPRGTSGTLCELPKRSPRPPCPPTDERVPETPPNGNPGGVLVWRKTNPLSGTRLTARALGETGGGDGRPCIQGRRPPCRQSPPRLKQPTALTIGSVVM